MRVAIYHHNRDIRLAEMPIPGTGPGELLVKVAVCGICGSDVLEWYRLPKAPLVLGHEAVGEIVQVGAGVEGYRVGQRVFVSHHVPCNTCHYCLSGHHTVCPTLRTTSYDPGGFAEYFRVPAINVDRGVFPLPGEMSDEEGAFIEPLGCAARGQRLARLRPGQSVLVMGCGVAGLLHIQLASALGAGRVIGSDPLEYRRRKARESGADTAIPPEELQPDSLRQLNGGRLADLVILATGALPALSGALELVEWGGTVLFFAPTTPGATLSLPFNQLWRNEVTLTSSYGAAPQDIEMAMELIRSRRVRVRELISHRLGLAATGMGFQMVSQAQDCLKVLIYPHR